MFNPINSLNSFKRMTFDADIKPLNNYHASIAPFNTGSQHRTPMERLFKKPSENSTSMLGKTVSFPILTKIPSMLAD